MIMSPDNARILDLEHVNKAWQKAFDLYGYTVVIVVYDLNGKQYHVSERDSGMIHRITCGLCSQVTSTRMSYIIEKLTNHGYAVLIIPADKEVVNRNERTTTHFNASQ